MNHGQATTDSPLRILLVDDERLALEGLRIALAQTANAEVVGAASDPRKALSMIEETRPDLLLLDVQMPGLSGLDLARALPAASAPEIVFVTAFEKYAPEAFAVEAVDFVLKPPDPQRLAEAVDRAVRRRRLRAAADRLAELERRDEQARSLEPDPDYQDQLWVARRDGEVRVPVRSIEWIEAARDYVLLHTPLRTWLYRTRMSALETRLDPRVMMRVHRSAFVRPSAVAEILNLSPKVTALKLESGAVVRIGALYEAEVLARLKGA